MAFGGGVQLGRNSPVLDVSPPPRCSPRRLLSMLLSALHSRRFLFTYVALITLVAKGVHIYAHKNALADSTLKSWGYSFFAQDFSFLIILHLLLNGRLDPARPGLLRALVSTLTSILAAMGIFLPLANICVFVGSGSEVHWQNIGVASDPAGRAVLMSGLTSSLFIAVGFFLGAAVLQVPVFFIFGLAADIVFSPAWLFSHCRATRGRIFSGPMPWTQYVGSSYSNIPQDDPEAKDYEIDSGDADSSDEKETFLYGRRDPIVSRRPEPLAVKIRDWRNWPWPLLLLIASYAAVLSALLASLILSTMRPRETTMTIMSWTGIALPFAGFGNSSSALQRIKQLYKTGIGKSWDSKTAVQVPAPFEWLPKSHIPEGFEDWYNNKKHYQATDDPLKISNLEDNILAELGALKDVPIRNVITILLESTRKDVFPVKLGGFTQQRLAKSFPSGEMPDDAVERLRTLTPMARFLTGDSNDGFDRPESEKKARGGINFNDAYTTSTYTLKSTTGALCGVNPLVADYNVEYKHHIYQPCLPQILDLMGQMEESHNDNGNRSWVSYPWRNSFMQSITMDFDNNGALIEAMGYKNIIDSQYMRKDSAKFGKVTLPDVNYFGFVEEPLLDYIRDEFESAKKNNERVLFSHITSTSHHPYKMPADEPYVELGAGLNDLSRYVNAIGYDDRWLGKILNLLEEMGVANETLIVLAGDHGLSIPENGKLPTYYNPNTISNHVPLVISHPLLPPITVNSSVSTRQILPTILDLLVETGSLNDKATNATRELVANYEGQSLIRPVRQTGANFHFTIINPGSAHLSIRDALHKNYHIVIPTVDNQEWHFSVDEHDEENVILNFDFHNFLRQIASNHGLDAAHWAEEAAFIGRWWVEENAKRWRYGPYAAY